MPLFADLKDAWAKSLGLRYFVFFIAGFVTCAGLGWLGLALARS